MNSKIIKIIVGLVLVIAVGSLVYFTKKPFVVPVENNTNQVQTVSTSTQEMPAKIAKPEDVEDYKIISTPVVNTTTTIAAPSGITLAQIAEHNSRSSCWSAINGNVYDLTSWIPNHPGGEKKILSLCGIDGSSGYNGQHGGDSKTARVLGGFKIGAYAK